MTNVFDNLFENVELEEPTIEQETTTEPEATEASSEVETPAEASAEASAEPETSTETTTPSQASAQALTASDIRRIYQEEESRKIAEYQAQEAAKLEAKQKLDKELAEMPDPIVDIVGYKKWQLERERKLEQSYQDRLNSELASREMAKEMEVLGKTLQQSQQSAFEKYGRDTVIDAEKWATQLIAANPEYAKFVKENPSYDYVTKEYLKFKEREAFERDPDQFIRDKVAKMNVDKVDTTPKKVPPKSITSIKSTNDPQPELPVFLKGLF